MDPDKSSKFSMVSNRYIFKQNEFVCSVLSLSYAKPLLEKLRELESTQGTEYAEKVLQNMKTGALRLVLSDPTEMDKSIIRSLLASPGSKPGIGIKRTCVKCSNKFYDLEGKIKACPSCHTPY